LIFSVTAARHALRSSAAAALAASSARAWLRSRPSRTLQHELYDNSSHKLPARAKNLSMSTLNTFTQMNMLAYICCCGFVSLPFLKQVTARTGDSMFQLKQQRTWSSPHAAVPRAALLLLPPPPVLPQHVAFLPLQPPQLPPALRL
jgi:hypothetical protein